MISTEAISSKKELLLEQIENYQHSGYFTEKEMDRLCAPIKLELELLELVDCHNTAAPSCIKKLKSFEDLKDRLLKIIKHLKVKDNNKANTSEILTQNNIQG